MQCEVLFAKIDELQKDFLKFWIDVCNIESPTAYKPGVDAVGRYFSEQAEKYGWQVEVHHEDVSGDAVCITMNPDADAAPICFSGHMDTVHPIGSFGSPAVRVDGDFIYGPGVKDCKGGCVASFYAMAALAACGFKSRPVKLLLQSDEENSSATSKKGPVRFMAEKAKGAVGFFNTEGYQRDKVCLIRKGILKSRMTISGQATHASRCFAGASAIREAAYKIVGIEKFKEKDGITCNCGIIQGGTFISVVPETCVIDIDTRFTTVAQLEEMKKFFTELAANSTVEGTTAQWEIVSIRDCMERCERNQQLFEAFNRICVENGLPSMEIRVNTGGSDAADMTCRGIPAVDSLGVVGDGTHSLREVAEIPSLKESAKRLAAVAYCI